MHARRIVIFSEQRETLQEPGNAGLGAALDGINAVFNEGRLVGWLPAKSLEPFRALRTL